MSAPKRFAICLTLALCYIPFLRASAPQAPAQLRCDPQEILEAVARQMNVALRPDIARPAIRLESATPLRRFQDAIAAQWSYRPGVFANAYAVGTNEIYLIDEAAYYKRMHRTIDDSLAHELVHYLQVHYFGADCAREDCEPDAVALQEWFRESYAPPAGHDGHDDSVVAVAVRHADAAAACKRRQPPVSG